MDKGNSSNESLEQNEASSESPNTFASSGFNPETADVKSEPVTPPASAVVNSPQPEVKNTPSNEFITTASNPESNKSKFGKFVIFGLILTALIYGIVFFLYTRNQNIKQRINNVVNNPIFEGGENSGETITPVPTFSADYVKVVNGNIVYESGSESNVLVNKNDFPSTGITGFTRVTVSPDNSKICFETLPPAIESGVYIAKSDGKETLLVSDNRTKCIFTHDSKKILYESYGIPASDIYIYDIVSSAEKNLTDDLLGEQFNKIFKLEGLSADGTKAVCSEKDESGEILGNCEIDLESGELTYN